MKIYVHELSGHSHRARLFASLLGLDAEIVPVDLRSGAHKQLDYLAKNPFGQVPTLEDGDVTVHDSNAILVYLARRYDQSGTWYPLDPQPASQIQMWLSKAANELAHGVAAARLVTVFGASFDLEAKQKAAHTFLAIVDRHLQEQQRRERGNWLVGTNPTIADIAHYTYIAHAPEGGVSLAEYTAVQEWLKRVESLTGFVAMKSTKTEAKSAL